MAKKLTTAKSRIVPATSMPLMGSDADFLRFLVDFVQHTLNSFREGAWMDLIEDLRLFIGEEEGKTCGFKRADIIATQQEFAEALRASLDARQTYLSTLDPMLAGEEIPLLDVARPTAASMLLSTQAKVVLDWGPHGVRAKVISSHFRDHFLFQVSQILLRNGIDTIRVCPRCSRVFYATHGRQKFCSTQCGNEASWQRFSSQHKSNPRSPTNKGPTRRTE